MVRTARVLKARRLFLKARVRGETGALIGDVEGRQACQCRATALLLSISDFQVPSMALFGSAGFSLRNSDKLLPFKWTADTGQGRLVNILMHYLTSDFVIFSSKRKAGKAQGAKCLPFMKCLSYRCIFWFRIHFYLSVPGKDTEMLPNFTALGQFWCLSPNVNPSFLTKILATWADTYYFLTATVH